MQVQSLWLYQTLLVWNPCPALSPGLPALACGPPCPILWPYYHSHVRPSSSALYSGPNHPLQVRHPSSTQSLGPTTPHRLGLLFPCPRPLAWPYQPSQVPLHCLMINSTTEEQHIILNSISVRESLICSYKWLINTYYSNSAIAKLLHQLYSDWKYICKWYSL